MRAQTTSVVSICCSDSLFFDPARLVFKTYQKLAGQPEKHAVGRAIAPDPQICTCLAVIAALANITSFLHVLIATQEKEAQGQEKNPHNPPGPAPLIQSGHEQRQAARPDRELGVIRG